MTSNPSILRRRLRTATITTKTFVPSRFSGKGAETIYEPSASRTCRKPPTSSGLFTTGLTAKMDMSAWRSIRTWRTTLRARLRKPAGCGPRWAGRMSHPRCRQRANGLPAIQQLIMDGISVNVTLLFGLPRYRQVAEAYIAGLETRAARAAFEAFSSVASFFVSRIDALVDPLLEKLIAPRCKESDLARKAHGQSPSPARRWRIRSTKRFLPATGLESWLPKALEYSGCSGPAPARRTRTTVT